MICLGILDDAAQFNQFSSAVGWIAEADGLKNEKLAQHFSKPPSRPFTFPIVGTGFVICVLATWRLLIETRPKRPTDLNKATVSS